MTENIIENIASPDAMPEVNLNAIAAVSGDTLPPSENEKTENTKLKKDGTPAKKRGRKPVNSKVVVDKNAQQKPSELIEVVDSKEAATVISGVLEQMQVVLISDEFVYNQAERDNNIEAWRRTLDDMGGVQLSPAAQLAISHASIILVRAQKPKTKTKIEQLQNWFSRKWLELKAKKYAFSNNRSNTKRENDTGQKDSESVQN